MQDYQEFLETKRLMTVESGIEIPEDAIHPRLFPFQRALVKWALRKGRAALFADTGLGKTSMQLEFARLTGMRSLIIAPLSVARQTVSEAKKIDLVAHYTRSGEDLIPGINITNYEMIHHFNAADFGAVILDESSILKTVESKTKTLLIEMFATTPYKLCCTATPAPNDVAEIANHAEFLGAMSRTEMLSTYFVHDSDETAHAGWRLKKHAVDPFYRWMASWSMSIKKPSDLGFDDTGYILPELSVKPVIVSTDYTPEGKLFYTGLKGIQDRSQARTGTIEERVQKTVEMVQGSDEQWILWCGRNTESTMLRKSIPESVEVVGSDSPDKKIKAIEAFQDGRVRVLITKASIAGFGINLQNCHNMAFVGIGDSFEDYYQCIRRCWRFGQEHPVSVSIVISEIEQEIYANVMRKEREAKIMSDQLIGHVQAYEQEELGSAPKEYEYNSVTSMIVPKWLVA